MQSLSCAALTLLAFTSNIYCASSSHINKAQQPAWTTDPVLASTVAYNIGYRPIIAYHETAPYVLHQKRQGDADNFGFIISRKEQAPALYVSKTEFEQAFGRSGRFEVRDSIFLEDHEQTTVWNYINSSKSNFLLLTIDEVIPVVVDSALKMHTLAAAAQHLRTYMPELTFVLFDVTEYHRKKLGVKLIKETKYEHRKSL